MPQVKSASTQSPAPAFAVDSDTILAMTTQQMRAAAQMNKAMLKGLAAFHEEFSNFITHRLEEDLNLQQAVTGSKTPQDAIEACTSFLHSTMAEYSDEVRKLASIITDNGFNGLAQPSDDNGAGRKSKAHSAPQ